MKKLLTKLLETRSNPLVIGIICLTIIEVVALLKGVNGVVLTMVIGAIAAAIGITIPKPKWIK